MGTSVDHTGKYKGHYHGYEGKNYEVMHYLIIYRSLIPEVFHGGGGLEKLWGNKLLK